MKSEAGQWWSPVEVKDRINIVEESYAAAGCRAISLAAYKWVGIGVWTLNAVKVGDILHLKFNNGEEYLGRCKQIQDGFLTVAPMASTLKVEDLDEEIYIPDVIKYRVVLRDELPLYVGWRSVTRHLTGALEGAV